MSSFLDIPGLTEEQLYDLGKSFNSRLGYEEFAVPMLYSTAKKATKAQYIAHSFNYSLMIYDTYRPKTVTALAAEKLSELYNTSTIVFFYRNGYNGKIKSSYVKEVVESLPHTGLYYCGFSLGAWDFHDYLDVGDFTKAILIDGYDLDFTSETSLEEVYVVQSYEHYVDQYNNTLYKMYENNPSMEYQVIDLTENPAHVECGWWLFAPTDDEYYRYKDVDFGYPVYNIMKIV